MDLHSRNDSPGYRIGLAGPRAHGRGYGTG
jgi:hypothetical protein